MPQVVDPIGVFDWIWKYEQFSMGALAPILALGHYTESAGVSWLPVRNLCFPGKEYSKGGNDTGRCVMCRRGKCQTRSRKHSSRNQ